MIESLNLMKNLDGIPKNKMSNANQFFDQLWEKDAKNLVSWDGELFFELHNGTYTTMANNKKYNRQCEVLFRDVEMFASFYALFFQLLQGRKAVRSELEEIYSKELLDLTWKEVLLYHFHDILPGSSIKRVYDVTNERYPKLITILKKMKSKILQKIAEQVLLADASSKVTDPNSILLLNSLELERKEIIGITKNSESI